jgi:cell wall-associated NlpC family hydrolase
MGEVPMSTIRKIVASLGLVSLLVFPALVVAPSASAADSRGERVVQVARAQVGDKYQYGKAGPTRFDCSGLVQYAFKKATGKKLPHSSAALRKKGKKVSKPKKGDVVYTKGHVSIYLGNGKVVEAANPRSGVRVVKRWQKNPTYLRF